VASLSSSVRVNEQRPDLVPGICTRCVIEGIVCVDNLPTSLCITFRSTQSEILCEPLKSQTVNVL